MTRPAQHRLPPAPAEFHAGLRSALDLAFALTTPDAVLIGTVDVPAAPEPLATLPGQPVPRNEPPPARVPLLVLHAAPWRQRALRRFGGLLAEFSVNTDLQLRRDLADEAQLGRPVTARWLAAATVAHDPLGRGAALVEHARQLLARAYRPSDAEQSGRRVQALIDLHEARALLAVDPVGAQLMLGRALEQMIDYACAAAGVWLPAPAQRGGALAGIDRAAAVLLEACTQGYDLAANLRAAERLADRLLGMRAAPDWIGPRIVAAASGL